MFDENELQQIKLQYDAGQAARNKQKKPAPKKKGGRGGFASSLISEGGATGGAVGGAALGTTVLPGLGTVAGAALGGLLGGLGGSAAEQKVRDNKVDWKKAATEGLVSGATSAFVPGGAGKIAAKGLQQGTKSAAQEKSAAEVLKPSLMGKFKRGAVQASQEGSGLTVGQSVGRGKVLTPDKADEVQSFITQGAQKYGGIRPGKPIDQARDAQNVYSNVVKTLDDTLNKIDRRLDPQEPGAIFANAATKVADNPAVTGTTNTLTKFKAKIEKAKSLKELEAIRREADDLAYTSTGAGKSSAAAQSHAVRDAIDDFITPLSPEYKAVKGDYTLSRDALESTSKASKSARGVKIPLIGIEVGKQSLSGAKNKAAAKLSGLQGGDNSSSSLLSKFKKPAAAQLAVAGASNLNDLTVPQDDAPKLDQPALSSVVPETPTVDSAPSQVYTLENLYADMQRDPQNTEEYIATYEALNKATGSVPDKPLSAEASKVIATANSGLESLNTLTGMIEKGGVPLGTTVPGRGLLGGAGQNLLGTAGFDAAADNVADAMVRARTGAAATKEELALYRRLLPQAFDPPEVQQQKIEQVKNFFAAIANRTGTAGTDMQAAVGV